MSDWIQNPLTKALIQAMLDRKVSYSPPFVLGYNAIAFHYEEMTEIVYGEDIENAINAAYRVAWEPSEILRRFEFYLVDLNNRRKSSQIHAQ